VAKAIQDDTSICGDSPKAFAAMEFIIEELYEVGLSANLMKCKCFVSSPEALQQPVFRLLATSIAQKVTSQHIFRFRVGNNKQPGDDACGATALRSGWIPGSCDGGGILRSSALHHFRRRSDDFHARLHTSYHASCAIPTFFLILLIAISATSVPIPRDVEAQKVISHHILRFRVGNT